MVKQEPLSFSRMFQAVLSPRDGVPSGSSVGGALDLLRFDIFFRLPDETFHLPPPDLHVQFLPEVAVQLEL